MTKQFKVVIYLLLLSGIPTSLYANDNCFNLTDEPTKVCFERPSTEGERDHLVIIDVASNNVISQIDEYVTWSTLPCSDCPEVLRGLVADSKGQKRLKDAILWGHFSVSPVAFNSYYDEDRRLTFGSIQIGSSMFVFVRSSSDK